MARVGEMLGWAGNPLYQGLTSNRNALTNFGVGLASGSDFGSGLAQGAAGIAQGAQQDDAAAVLAQEQEQKQQALNQTTEWLRNNGKDALYQAVSSGAMEPGQAWQIALDEDAAAKAAASQGPNLTADMQNFQFAQANPGFADFINPASSPSAPSGYQWQPDGSQAFIPGGPADPAMAANKPPTETQNRLNLLSSVIDPELETVEKNWNDLTSGQNQAANAAPFGAGYSLTTPGYQQATNSLGTIAQSYLYAVSGASAPVEEVKKLVDSVTPKPFESAESVANKQLRIRQMAAAVKQAANGGRPQASTLPANTTSTGLSWSIEP